MTFLKWMLTAAGLFLAAVLATRELAPHDHIRILELRTAFEIDGETVVLEGPLFCVRPWLSYGPLGPGALGDFRPRPHWWGQVLEDDRILIVWHPRTICDGETGHRSPVVRLLDSGGPPSEDGEWLYLTRAALEAENGPLRLTEYGVKPVRNSASRLRLRLYLRDEDNIAPRDAIDYRRWPHPNFSSDEAAFVIPFRAESDDLARLSRDWPVQSDRFAVLGGPACDMATGLDDPIGTSATRWPRMERMLGLVGPPEHVVQPRRAWVRKTYEPDALRPLLRSKYGWSIVGPEPAPIRIDPTPNRVPTYEKRLSLPDGTRTTLRNGTVIWDRQEARAWTVFGPFPGCQRLSRN